MSGSIVSRPTNNLPLVPPAASNSDSSSAIELPLVGLKEGQERRGILYSVRKEGKYLIAHLGRFEVALPDQMFRTNRRNARGRKVDLHDWIGRKIGVSLFAGRYCTRPLPPTEEDRLRARVAELEAEVERLKAENAGLFATHARGPGQEA